jgi:hypothetical protein
MLAIVTLDRELESWERTLPPSLHLNAPPAEIDEAGAVIMRIRLLNARLLLHRPMLFHLCQRSLSLPLIGAAPSPLDRKLAHASSLQCVEAAVELINRVVNEPNRSSIGAWCMYCPIMYKPDYRQANLNIDRVPSVLLQFSQSGASLCAPGGHGRGGSGSTDCYQYSECSTRLAPDARLLLRRSKAGVHSPETAPQVSQSNRNELSYSHKAHRACHSQTRRSQRSTRL